MLITIWCDEHNCHVEGELRLTKEAGYLNSFASDTSEMWCPTWSGKEPAKFDTCHETWKTQVTIDSH